jgi:hypothetical protein
MDGLYLGREKLYIDRNTSMMWNGDSEQVEKTADGWVARKCKWGKQRRSAARRGDASTLHDMMLKQHWDQDVKQEEDTCSGAPVALAKARGKTYELMISSRWQTHAPIPTWNIDPQPPLPPDPDALPDEPKLGVSEGVLESPVRAAAPAFVTSLRGALSPQRGVLL